MGTFRHLLGLDRKEDKDAGLLPAVERAVIAIEPRLREASGYPERYRKPVETALEYVHDLACHLPGPVAVSEDAYARDAFVHAIFPSMDFISEALRTSQAVQEYLQKFPGIREIYALMGMRRHEKSTLGLALSGQVIEHDVPQDVVYFTSHTIVDPAADEEQARAAVGWSLFDSLAHKVAARIDLRIAEQQALREQKDIVTARLRTADMALRHELQAELARVLREMQSARRALDLRHYLEEFEYVLQYPEQHLRLDQTEMRLDSMGIKKHGDEDGQPVVFSDLIGFDRRDWTVTMVHCRDLPSNSFAARLEDAYRKLSL